MGVVPQPSAALKNKLCSASIPHVATGRWLRNGNQRINRRVKRGAAWGKGVAVLAMVGIAFINAAVMGSEGSSGDQ